MSGVRDLKGRMFGPFWRSDWVLGFILLCAGLGVVAILVSGSVAIAQAVS